MITHMGFKKYLGFIALLPPMVFTHDIFYVSVVQIMEQTTIYTQKSDTQH